MRCCLCHAQYNLWLELLTQLVLGPQGASKRAQEAATREISRQVDWDDITGGNNQPVPISEPENRAITLEQLQTLTAHVDRRLVSECWKVKRVSASGKLERKVVGGKQSNWFRQGAIQVNLYDIDEYVTRPATIESQLSLVEVCSQAEISVCCKNLIEYFVQLMATGLQPVDFFVSQ